MSVRRINGRGGNIIGSFPSLKNNRAVQYESTIERDLLYFLEYDMSVKSYTMQPMVISGVDSTGKARSYTPDALVYRTTGRTIIECKPAALCEDPHTQQQITLGEQWADENGYDFVLITDTDLRSGHRLANMKLLWRYARLQVPFAAIQRCLQILDADVDGMTFQGFQQALEGTAPSLMFAPYLYGLLFQHILMADLDQPLTASSRIYSAVLQPS